LKANSFAGGKLEFVGLFKAQIQCRHLQLQGQLVLVCCKI